MKKRNVLLSLVMCAALVFGLSSMVFASEHISNQNKQEILSFDPSLVELGTRDLTEEQINELVQNPVAAEERARQDVAYLLEKVEAEMDFQTISNTSRLVGLMATTITLGTNKTITTCDTGNEGSDTSGLGQTDGNTAKSRAWVLGVGSADSWAYTAATINVTGGGSQTASIIFYDSYEGMTNPGYMGASAAARVGISVWDLTTGTEVERSTPFSIEDSIDTISYYSGNANGTLTVNLQSGHTYLLRFGIGTVVSNYSPQMATADFYDEDSYGVHASSVKITF